MFNLGYFLRVFLYKIIGLFFIVIERKKIMVNSVFVSKRKDF